MVDYLKALGADVAIERNDAISIDAALERSDSLLISPGPGKPEAAGISVELARACMERNKPLLGVCLGHQAIAVACGFEVGRVAPVHGKIGPVVHDSTGLFVGLPSPLDATRYHSLGIAEVGAPLIANAWSDDGVVMGIRHEMAPVHGVQFHPESIGSTHGRDLLAAFIAITGGDKA